MIHAQCSINCLQVIVLTLAVSAVFAVMVEAPAGGLEAVLRQGAAAAVRIARRGIAGSRNKPYK